MNFQNKVNELRKKDILNFQTNYFMNEIREDAICLENDNAIICLSKDRDIYRLYFAYINLLDFENLLKQLPINIKISLEFITKKEIDSDLYNCINKYLPFDTVFERFRCKVDKLKIFKKWELNQIEYAGINDIEFILKTLEKTFNYYSSHLPTINQLKDLQGNNNIIVVKNNNKTIASFLIIKPNSKSINFDQLVGLDKNPLNLMKVIDSLNIKLKKEGYNEIFLWIDVLYNKDVIKLHKLYGYKPDNTKDYYFINNLLRQYKI